MTINNEYISLQKLVLIEKKYAKAIELIANSAYFDDYLFQELYADTLFALNDFLKSAVIYEKLNDYYKLGYCNLLLGDYSKAKYFWEKAPKSPAQNWGMFFCELFSEKVRALPTYLQIRAFLERDLGAFLKLNLVEFVQKIIDISEFLFDINPETNKIIARTFLYKNYTEFASEYLFRALEFTKEDAEIYYLLGLLNIKRNKTNEAKNNFQQAILLNNNYEPAKLLLNKL